MQGVEGERKIYSCKTLTKMARCQLIMHGTCSQSCVCALYTPTVVMLVFLSHVITKGIARRVFLDSMRCGKFYAFCLEHGI